MSRRTPGYTWELAFIILGACIVGLILIALIITICTGGLK